MFKPIDYSPLFSWIPRLFEPAQVFSNSLFSGVSQGRAPALRNSLIKTTLLA